jgi:hypothetical protein
MEFARAILLREPARRHFRVRFERFQWLAAPFPSRVLHLTPKPRRVSPMGSANRSCRLSEKQYQLPAGLARNCRFFLSSVPALNSANWPRLGSAEPSLQPSPYDQTTVADRITSGRRFPCNGNRASPTFPSCPHEPEWRAACKSRLPGRPLCARSRRGQR